jgi:cytochrome c553
LRNERSAEFMDDAIINLNDQQIIDLGAYYAAQSCSQSAAINLLAVPPLVSDRCVVCHGEKGIFRQNRYPNIAGQHRTYILDQLIEFKLAGLEAKTGTKNITRNKSMSLQVAELRNIEIKELATYFAVLPCQ